MLGKPKEKRKRRPLSRRRQIAVIVIIIGLVAALLVIATRQPDNWPAAEVHLSGEQAKIEIEKTFGVQLPPEATNFHYYAIAWQDYSVWLRFEISPAAFGAVITQSAELCFDWPITTDTEVPPTLLELDWWRLHEAASHVSARCGDNPYYDIFIDQTDPDIWIVYLNTFTT